MEYKCEICIKNYKSYQSLWNHNYKYHNFNILKKITNLYCKYCNKKISRIDNLHRHEIKCKIKNENISNFELEIIRLKNQLNTIKYNKYLLCDNSYTCKNNNKIIKIVNNNIINNINNSNINIANIGNENIKQLTQEQQFKILNAGLNAPITYIKTMFFNENNPDNHKFYVSALNDKHINLIEDKRIIKKKKSELFDILFIPCIKILEKILLINKRNLNNNKIKELKENIEYFYKIPIFKKLIKIYHEEVNLISYNNKDIIIKTWKKLLEDKTLTSDEYNVLKESIDIFLNENNDIQSHYAKL